MTTDTAKAIVETPEDGEHWGFCEAGIEFVDLRQMAKLWLLLPEIRDELTSAFEDFAGEGCQGIDEILSKITAIAGESKDGDTKYRG